VVEEENEDGLDDMCGHQANKPAEAKKKLEEVSRRCNIP
jgi:hypothetical protein